MIPLGRIVFTVIITAVLVFGGLLVFTEESVRADEYEHYEYYNGTELHYPVNDLWHNCQNVPAHLHRYK